MDGSLWKPPHLVKLQKIKGKSGIHLFNAKERKKERKRNMKHTGQLKGNVRY